MSKVNVYLADGFEEVEGLTVVDLLRRAGIETDMVSIMGRKEIVGARKIPVLADKLFEEQDNPDVIVLPGGMPGTKNLMACRPLCDALVQADAAGKRLAAICAAPSILGQLGLLKDKKATCYPGFEDRMDGAFCTGEGVVTDRLITTACGVGWSLDLGLELVRLLIGESEAAELKKTIQYVH